MPVTLRSINNPAYDTIVMQAVKTVIVGYPTPNTQLAASSSSQTGLENVFINNAWALEQATSFPCVHLHSGPQPQKRNSRSTYVGMLHVFCDYFDRYEANSTDTIDAIYARISTDLYRMMSNLQTNDSLTQNFQAFAQGMPECDLSPYSGQELDDKSVPGLTIVRRTLTMSFDILPYDCLV